MHRSVSKKVLEYLKTSPRKTNREIAEAINLPYQRVATATSRMCLSTRELARVPAEQNARGNTIYAYSIASPVADTPEAPQPHGVPPPPRSVGAVVNLPSLDALLDAMAEALATRLRHKVWAVLAEEVAALTPPKEPTSRPDPDTDLDLDFEQALATLGDDDVPAPAPIIEYAAQKPTQRLRVVLVVGLLPSQAGMISAEFSQCFNLKFWKDESHTKLKAMAAGADVIVVMTGKVSHRATDAISAVAHYEPIRGGLTTLREYLTSLYVEGA